MWRKVFSVKDSRASIVTPFANNQAAFAFNYDQYATNLTASASGYSPPARKICNPKRIITFHAKASWLGYLEASKALNNLVVIDFTNACYEPFRHMEQAFNEFAATYTNAEFVKIDVDELFDIARHYGVRTTPTVLFIKKGKEIDRAEGARKEELQRKIEMHI